MIIVDFNFLSLYITIYQRKKGGGGSVPTPCLIMSIIVTYRSASERRVPGYLIRRSQVNHIHVII